MVHQPVVDILRARGVAVPRRPVRRADDDGGGPKVLEFNCRFGDPETQAVLPRLRSDLVEVLEACLRPGGLADVNLEWSPDWAVTVVMASAGYPASVRSGDEITGLAVVRAWRSRTPGPPSRTGGS